MDRFVNQNFSLQVGFCTRLERSVCFPASQFERWSSGRCVGKSRVPSNAAQRLVGIGRLRVLVFFCWFLGILS